MECIPNNDVTSCESLNVYETYAFADRICVPKNPQMTNSVLSKMSVSVWNENVKDMKDAWPIYIVMFLITIIICVIFYYLLEHCTNIMIFIMIGGAIIGLVILGVINWKKY